ncbi:FINGER PROTEIN putative-RELATED [Salix viminalis]|uniref:FINGER PROTEIN putative-RELATED n=1 Tax=Salix viminalis TaxID=40686 RepID=A0A9Q0NLM3_SALVM|nr:FINGER PROTEIN putative-RELATED [Salix viminalis]
MDPINSSTPPLCAKGCGFFGSPEKKIFCSRCYDDYFIEELIAEPSKKLSELIVTPSADDHSTDVLTEETASETTSAAAASTPAVKNRCECCNKKVGLMGFNCRCGKNFCRAHRYPKDHSCTFDFKTLDQQNLAKQNPLVAGDKLGSRI